MGKKRVIFMLTRPVFWNIYKNLYYKFKDNSDYEPIVFLCGETINHIWAVYKNEIPKEKLLNTEQHLLTHTFNNLIEFAKINKLNYVSGYNEENSSWLALESFNPELVFYCDPYDSYYLKKDWEPQNASEKYKVAYIHYGYLLINTLKFYRNPIFKKAWKVFIETPEHTKIAEEENEQKVTNFIELGYPKFDDYYIKESNFKENFKKYKSDKYSKILVYAPHWTVSPKKDRSIGWYGNFVDIYEKMISLINDKDDVFWIFKPHPLLLPQLSHNYGESKANEIFNAFRGLENLEFYEGYDYINLFKISDGIILDSNSFVAEYMPSGKPIIFIQKKEDLMLNKIGTDIFDACYRINYENDIKEIVQKVIFEEKDVKKLQRVELTNKYLIIDKECSPSENIYNYILNNIEEV